MRWRSPQPAYHGLSVIRDIRRTTGGRGKCSWRVSHGGPALAAAACWWPAAAAARPTTARSQASRTAGRLVDRRPPPPGTDVSRPARLAHLPEARLGPLQGHLGGAPRAGRRLAVRDAQGAAGLREAGRRDDRARADPQPRRPGQDRGIGSLLFNFGGPGGSRRLHAAVVRGHGLRELHERYDLVSFDPRGVGRQRGRALPQRQGRSRPPSRWTPPRTTPAEEAALPQGRGRLRRGLREGRREAAVARRRPPTPPATWT